MNPLAHDMEFRLRDARRRLELLRGETEKLARLAKNPDDLDLQVPALSRRTFTRRLEMVLASSDESSRRTALCCIDIGISPTQDPQETGRLRLACDLLLRNTRAGDIIGRVEAAAFAILLEDTDTEGAKCAAVRLGHLVAGQLETLSATRPKEPGIRIAALGLAGMDNAAMALQTLLGNLREIERDGY